jgi:hypothetical protein
MKHKAWSRRIDGLRAARDWAETAQIPPDHRHVVILSLESERERSLDALANQERTERDGHRWTDEDIQILTSTLGEKIATSWALETYHLEMASERLGRSPKAIKRKAIELNLGPAVDYWLNRIDSD